MLFSHFFLMTALQQINFQANTVYFSVFYSYLNKEDKAKNISHVPRRLTFRDTTRVNTYFFNAVTMAADILIL